MVIEEKFLEKIYKKNFNELTKEDADALMRIPCKGRGENILSSEKEALKLGGKEGVGLFKEEIKKLGCPIDFKKINPLEWYPIGIRTITLIVLQGIFKLGDDDMAEMGARFVASSFVVKFLFKHFFSPKIAFQRIPGYWKKNYTCGRIEPVKFYEGKNKEGSSRGYFIVRLHDFKIHPIYCKIMPGSFLQLAKLLGRREGGDIKETKCMFKGDPYHEYIIW